ncbi:MAG TPA: hypothetical protein VIK86_04420 [Candidatus Paceibacterota bacterium]
MIKDRVDLYKDMYKLELDTRNTLNTEITLPIAIITVNFGALVYSIGKIELITTIIPLIIVIISIIVLLGSICFSVGCIIKEYYNYEYSLVPNIKLMNDYYNELCKHCNKNNNLDNTKKIDELFQLYLIDAYGIASEKNTSNNDNRASFLHKAKTAVIAGLIASAFAVSFCNYNIISNVHNCFNKISISEGDKNGARTAITKTEKRPITNTTTK